MGHDCHTVHDEALRGAADPVISDRCRAENRVRITLDLDFADIRAYPPGSHPGIVILRPKEPDRDRVLKLLQRIAIRFVSSTVDGSLWIVEENRIRIRRSDSPDTKN